MSLPEVTVASLFESIGQAGFDIARAMREHNDALGTGASSALLNALAMLPKELRDDLIEGMTDRSHLSPILQELAL